jgi:hypothetical protein
MSMIKTARIRLAELYQDSINFVKTSYNQVGQYFTMASPMGQLLQVLLNIGRMILYYVEDSITELNIRTASRAQSVKGLASLTGHNPSRGMAARGTLRLTYNGQSIDVYGNTVIIPNYTKIVSSINGLTYTVVLPGEEVRVDLTSTTNFVDVDIVQGSLEYQQATGTGDPLQSFNFQSKKGASIDNYFVNVYVDGKRWPLRDSILDMVYREEGVMVKTGQTGGIDIFFGNGYNGKIPPLGSTILVEYLLTDGQDGNLERPTSQSEKNWKFETKGYALNSQEIDLNKVLKVTIQNDVIFGALEEPVYLTRLLAPHMSRSFVLANSNSYIYFLRKLNMFTIVDALPGFATFEDQYALDKYNTARTTWENINEEYRVLLATIGADATQTQDKKTELDTAQQQVYYWQSKVEEEKQDDNTVYLYLVPDVNKRISANQNYYTCSLNSFILTAAEKRGILDLIEESGQRVLTVDNAIMSLKYSRFVLNVSLIIYEGYELNTIRENIISKTSDYFLKNTRRDRIPQSDIVRIIENIDGVDSVTVWFDADAKNSDIYGVGRYGLDSYGDILLQRYVKDAFGNEVPVKDIYPLIRGGWESTRGIYYDDSTRKDKLSNVNIQLRGITPVDLNSETNKTIVSNL